MRFFGVFQKFKKQVALVFFIVLVEKVAWIIEPLIFGEIIDAMIGFYRKHLQTDMITPLLLWVVVYLINSTAGAIGRSFGEKTYLNMFTDIVADVTAQGLRRGHPATRTAARADLSREFIIFLQYHVPETLEQIVDIAGAVIALALFDYRISLACLILILPLIFVSRIYNNRVMRLQSELHDSREEVLATFESHDVNRVRSYYANMAVTQQRIANWTAFNFGVFRFFLLIVFLIVLYIIGVDRFSAGKIYSIVADLGPLVPSADYWPELLESWTSLKKIPARLQEETEPAAPLQS